MEYEKVKFMSLYMQELLMIVSKVAFIDLLTGSYIYGVEQAKANAKLGEGAAPITC